MRAASQASLQAAGDRLEALWRLAGADTASLGEQILGFGDVVRGSGMLRRALTDPAADPDNRARLVTDLLGDEADERVVDLLAGLVRSRWSHEDDIAEALESLGRQAVLAGAESEHALDTVEEDLFRTQRFLVANRGVREALSSRSARPQDRVQLVRALFDGSVHPRTLQLLVRVAATESTSGSVAAVAHLAEAAAERRSRTVALVVAASTLTREQEQQLAARLARAYGRQVQLNVTVDPAVLGGMRVQVGPDVIDGTVQARLADARRALAG